MSGLDEWPRVQTFSGNRIFGFVLLFRVSGGGRKMINSHWKSIVAGSSSETLPVGRKTSGCDLETVLSKRDHGGQVTFLTTILFKNIVAQLFLQAGRGVEPPPGPSLRADERRGAVGHLLERVCCTGNSCSGGKRPLPALHASSEGGRGRPSGWVKGGDRQGLCAV